MRFTIVADILLWIIPTTQKEREAFTYLRFFHQLIEKIYIFQIYMYFNESQVEI